jgi:hypothetical protein
MTKQTHWSISGDGLFFGGLPYGGCLRFEKNRPIDSDSYRNRAKFESRKFSFEIKSEKI